MLDPTLFLYIKIYQEIYFKMLTNVNLIHVKMEQHALMESIPILANALKDILATIVRQVRFDNKLLQFFFDPAIFIKTIRKSHKLLFSFQRHR